MSTNQSILTDKDIIHGVLRNSADVNSDEDDMEVSEVESIRKPLIEKVRRAIEMFEEFSLCLDFGKGIMKSVREVNHYVNREKQKTRKQSNMTDFLEKIRLISRLKKLFFCRLLWNCFQTPVPSIASSALTETQNYVLW